MRELLNNTNTLWLGQDAALDKQALAAQLKSALKFITHVIFDCESADTFMQPVLMNAIKLARRLRPDLKFGVYQFTKSEDYYTASDQDLRNQTQAAAGWLDVVDFLAPGIYIAEPGVILRNWTYFANTVAAALHLAAPAGKQVFPITSDRYMGAGGIEPPMYLMVDQPEWVALHRVAANIEWMGKRIDGFLNWNAGRYWMWLARFGTPENAQTTQALIDRVRAVIDAEIPKGVSIDDWALYMLRRHDWMANRVLQLHTTKPSVPILSPAPRTKSTSWQGPRPLIPQCWLPPAHVQP